MDKVYEFATTARTETGTAGVLFRFMPDAAQVDAAVKVHSASLMLPSSEATLPLF